MDPDLLDTCARSLRAGIKTWPLPVSVALLWRSNSYQRFHQPERVCRTHIPFSIVIVICYVILNVSLSQ